ncbi:MAG: ATP-binding protein [Treponema sp.]|nr:ATP-binding protein [Treponema sp.]
MLEISKTLGIENATVEYKLAAGGLPKSLWETYSSFANSFGGIIVLGVKEAKGKFCVQGVENQSALLKDFWNTVNNTE